MLVVRNLTEQIKDKRQRPLSVDKISRAIIHRIDFSKDDGAGYWRWVKPCPRHNLDGLEVAKRFVDARKVPERDRKVDAQGRDVDWRHRPGAWTGGEVPYHFLVRTDGVIDQMLRVGDYGPHARRWSWSGVAIAVAGDFRLEHDTPTPDQLEAVIAFSTLWVAWLGGNARDVLFGHSELPGGSSDSDKICPGHNLDPASVRWHVDGRNEARISRDEAEQKLKALGVVF